MILLFLVLSLLVGITTGTPTPAPSSAHHHPHVCKHVDAALDSLSSAWDENYGYTRPCGTSTDECMSGLLSTWSSTFTSAANARFNASRAKVEFNNLMKGQWRNGFLPHAIFLSPENSSSHTNTTQEKRSSNRYRHRLHHIDSSSSSSSSSTGRHHNTQNHSNNSNHSHASTHPIGNWTGLTPGPAWWKISVTNKYGTVRTSGVAAPPTQATAALQIYLYLWHEHPTGTTAHEFLHQAFVNVYNWHQYLHTQRDPDRNGLTFIRHPWESPLSWNASSVASALSRAIITSVPPTNLTLFPATLERLPGFPGNKTYAKMLGIAACQGQLNWEDSVISKISPNDLSSPCGFLVEDIAFNSLLLRADHDLYTISTLLLQDKQEPEYDSDIIEMQVQIQQWISLMESTTALGSPKIVRKLPTTDVAAGAVMISTDLSHPNASATDHFDVGSLFPLMTADRISTNLATSLSTTALSPLFWSRYPLSLSSLLSYSEEALANTKDSKDSKDMKDMKDTKVIKDMTKDIDMDAKNTASVVAPLQVNILPQRCTKRGAYLTEIPIAIHVTGLLVEAWAMDVSGEQGLTLKVLANFMSSQARTLFPGCPVSKPPHPFYDYYGSDTGRPLPSTAEFGVVISSPRAAAVAIILSNLTLPDAPPIPPVGLGMTLVIMWAELIFAFTVGFSCILLAVYHIRLISKQDQEEVEARANAYRQREESSYRGDSDAYGTESGDDMSSTKDEESDMLDFPEAYSHESPSARLRQSTISSEGHGYSGGWMWPLSYVFGGQTTSERSDSRRPSNNLRSSSGYLDSPQPDDFNDDFSEALLDSASGSELGENTDFT